MIKTFFPFPLQADALLFVDVGFFLCETQAAASQGPPFEKGSTDSCMSAAAEQTPRSMQSTRSTCHPKNRAK